MATDTATNRREDETGTAGTSRAVPERVAAIGRVRNPFSERVLAKVTPDSLTRILKMSAELSDQMAFIKLMLRDPQVSTCMRNLSMAVSRQEIRITPFDEKSRVAKKRAERDEKVFKRAWVKKLVRRLVYGEFYPLAGAELHINRDFIPVGADVISATRWTWSRDTNQLHIRTVANPNGQAIPDRRGFIIHTSALEPGEIREGGMWHKTAWPWLFKWSAYSWLMRFANKFGEPWLWAFFEKLEDKDAVLETLTEMSNAARGAFPRGTEINFKEPQRYSTVHIYDTIFDRSDAYITKVIQGHMLNTDAQSGTGTLAGNAAAAVSEENKAGVTEGINDTFQTDIMEPYAEWQDGERAVENGEVSQFEIVCKPPEDLVNKAKVHGEVNKLLAPHGRAIGVPQIEQSYDVQTVELKKVTNAPADSNGASANGDAADKTVKAARAVAAAKKEPQVRTLADVVATSTAFGTAAAIDQATAIVALAKEVAERGGTPSEFRNALFERYDRYRNDAAGELAAQGMVVAAAIGAGDEAVKA